VVHSVVIADQVMVGSVVLRPLHNLA
jgi:hypothetical protein